MLRSEEVFIETVAKFAILCQLVGSISGLTAASTDAGTLMWFPEPNIPLEMLVRACLRNMRSGDNQETTVQILNCYCSDHERT